MTSLAASMVSEPIDFRCPLELPVQQEDRDAGLLLDPRRALDLAGRCLTIEDDIGLGRRDLVHLNLAVAHQRRKFRPVGVGPLEEGFCRGARPAANRSSSAAQG